MNTTKPRNVYGNFHMADANKYKAGYINSTKGTFSNTWMMDWNDRMNKCPPEWKKERINGWMRNTYALGLHVIVHISTINCLQQTSRPDRPVVSCSFLLGPHLTPWWYVFLLHSVWVNHENWTELNMEKIMRWRCTETQPVTGSSLPSCCSDD